MGLETGVGVWEAGRGKRPDWVVAAKCRCRSCAKATGGSARALELLASLGGWFRLDRGSGCRGAASCCSSFNQRWLFGPGLIKLRTRPDDWDSLDPYLPGR